MRKKKGVAVENSAAEVCATEEVAQACEMQRIKEFLENVLQKMDVCNCSVQMEEREDALYFDVTGENTTAVIGYHGEVLDALQYLCSLRLNGKNGSGKRVVVDTNNYREKREKTLRHLAVNLESKVKRTGHPAKLEPMNPYERRIIHTALQSSHYVTTASEGEGNSRHVVVFPKEQNNILNAPNAPRKTLNFVYRSEKKRRK